MCPPFCSSTTADDVAACSRCCRHYALAELYNYFTNLIVASKYAKKYINKYNATKKKEKKKKTRT